MQRPAAQDAKTGQAVPAEGERALSPQDRVTLALGLNPVLPPDAVQEDLLRRVLKAVKAQRAGAPTGLTAKRSE